MAKTYLQLVNEVLRGYNQVELTAANFEDSRGIHSWAKDGVNMALRQINTESYKWPFNAVEHTETLVAGTYEYAWPSAFKTADWNSFQIQKDEDLGVSMTTLKLMDRDEWYRRYRDLDDEATIDAVGRNVPYYVFKTHGNGYGLTPNPNAAFEIKYRYYTYSTELSEPTDTTLVPDQFAHVIILGASHHFSRMMDGLETSVSLGNDFRIALRQMRSLLINDEEYASDTRVNY
jgi:hypothetical protein